MRQIKSGFLWALVIFLGFVNPAVSSSEVAKIYTSYFPRFVEDNPERPGVAYEVVTELFKIAGIKYEVIALPWARSQHMAKTTPGSLIFPLSWTPTRDQSYEWSVNIYNSYTHFITFNDTKLTAESAKEKLVGVQLKSSWDNWLIEQGYTKVYRVPDEGASLVKLLENDRLDAWYTEQFIANTVLKDVKGYKVTFSDPIQVFRTFLATSKNAPYPYMDKLKAAMEKMQKSGRFVEIFNKYETSPNF